MAMWRDDDEDGIPEAWKGFKTTDKDGYYLFSDLTPGIYQLFVWEVDNWNEGQPLYRMINTVGSYDPNNDVDGDDNGQNGSDLQNLNDRNQISKPIIITADGEPLLDGDRDDNNFDYDPSGNMTIDFGFYSVDDECPVINGIIKGSESICPNDSIGFLKIIPASGFGPYQFQWSNEKTTSFIEGLSPGDYHVTITDIQGCKGSASFQILTSLSEACSACDIDDESPLITILSSEQIVECSDAEKPSLEYGTDIFAIDNCDGDISADIVLSHSDTITVLCDDDNIVLQVIDFYTVSDASGNEAMATRTVSFRDTNAPEWDDPSMSFDIQIECTDNNIDSLLSMYTPRANDHCGFNGAVVDLVDTNITISCGGAYEIKARFIAKDNCANVNNVEFEVNISIRDSKPPNWDMNALDTTILLGCNDNFDDVALDNNPIALDKCGVSEIILDSKSEIEICGDQSEVVYTYIASDGCGNANHIPYSLRMIRPISLGPTISGIPEDIIIQCAEPYPNIEDLLANITAFDVCDGDLTKEIEISELESTNECFDKDSYTHRYIISVQNNCGINTEAFFKVSVINDVHIDLEDEMYLCDGGFVVLDA
ncbi:MAG: hypothetical protein P8M34_03275, partial [Saprospiraceae bacterium]|nr:hypothetical protein [Saprospiraceae bacterium]